MLNKLTELTDRVLKEVMKNEVILPSTYKEHFENHAREMQINLNYETMVDKVIQKRLHEANEIAEKTYCNLDLLQKSTLDAQEAIQNQDLSKLAEVSKEISQLRDEMNELRVQLHTDSLTKLHNRKWLSQNLLHEGNFTSEGMLALVDLDKFNTINKEHGHIVGDKVLQYMASFLHTNLYEMELIRYAGDVFIIISKNEQMEKCYMRLKALQENLLSKKLKAANGDLLYLSFSFGLARFERGSKFRDVLEIADALMSENKKQKNMKSEKGA